MTGVSSAELEAALFSSAHLMEEPSMVEGFDASTWRTQAERLRGVLNTRLEFACAATWSAREQGEDREDVVRLLEQRYAQLRAMLFDLAEIDPQNNEDQRSVAFQLSRLACVWVCRLWCFEYQFGLKPVADDDLRAMLAEAMERIDSVDQSGRTRSLDERAQSQRLTCLSVMRRLTELTTRFDFFHQDRVALTHACLDKVYEVAGQAVDGLDDGASDLFDDVVLAAADVFVTIYMAEARRFREWFLTAPPEEAAHAEYLAGLSKGMDMKPIFEQFKNSFQSLVALSFKSAQSAREHRRMPDVES